MVPLDPAAFHASLPGKGRLMALDPGTRTIGVAISDVERSFVSPLETVRRAKLTADIAKLQNLIVTHQICGMVIGYPLNMDGSEGPRCQSVRQFQRELERRISLPMLLWDERQTSLIAEEQMQERGVHPRDKADLVDKLAAAAILQSLFNHLRSYS